MDYIPLLTQGYPSLWRNSIMAEKQAPSRRGGASTQNAPRRNDVIRCDKCGEYYAITYKRCPFCDERPGRGGGSGRRVANTRGGGYGGR